METKSDTDNSDVKTSTHASRYLIIGIIIAITNYGLFAIIANLIIKNSDLLWLSSFIASAIVTVIAYILHSKYTWKERKTTKKSIYRFLIWNIVLTVIVNPGLTQLFSLITPLYQFAYNASQAIHLPFSYDFVQSTGAFILTAIVTTILNFFFYDRFVFGKTKNMVK